MEWVLFIATIPNNQLFCKLLLLSLLLNLKLLVFTEAATPERPKGEVKSTFASCTLFFSSLHQPSVS
uniref:Putative ovule protein n=1 Tax=Solanum chacoense TaxID=4108 RepID=A0A0V0H7F9_SOLCH